MNQQNYDDFEAGLEPVLLGNKGAIEYCMSMVFLADAWDDAIDELAPCEHKINKAFMLCLFGLDDMVFYNQNKLILKPLMLSVVLRWMDANKLEKDAEHLEKAYMLRAGLYDIFSQCAYILGGYEHYKVAGPIIRKMYGEEFQDYKIEVLSCQTQ